MLDASRPTGPIPGENLLSDSKNYPWKRPPEADTPDKALELLFRSLKKRRNAQGLLNMLELGFTISFITNIMLLKGVEQGRWAIDTALLMAGPISHMIVIMAREYDIDYQVGLEGDTMLPDKEFFQRAKKVFSKNKQDKAVKKMEETVDSDGSAGEGVSEIAGEMTGFSEMTPESTGEQTEDLGGFMS